MEWVFRSQLYISRHTKSTSLNCNFCVAKKWLYFDTNQAASEIWVRSHQNIEHVFTGKVLQYHNKQQIGNVSYSETCQAYRFCLKPTKTKTIHPKQQQQHQVRGYLFIYVAVPLCMYFDFCMQFNTHSNGIEQPMNSAHDDTDVMPRYEVWFNLI